MSFLSEIPEHRNRGANSQKVFHAKPEVQERYLYSGVAFTSYPLIGSMGLSGIFLPYTLISMVLHHRFFVCFWS